MTGIIKINLRETLDSSIDKLLEKLDPQVGIEALKKRIAEKTIFLYDVLFDSKRLGIFIARIDTLYDGEKELVIMHAVSDFEIEHPLTSVLNPVFDSLAKELGIKSVRIHSERRGIDKLLEDSGYKFIENVFQKRVE
jgi:hypothetical protein